MELNDSVSAVKGIGDKTEKNLNKLGIYTVSNLLEHYPRGYDVYEGIVPINSVREGEIAAIEAALTKSVQTKKVRNLTIVNCSVKDRSGGMNLTWFNMPFLKNSLKMGTYYIFRGRVVRKNGILVIEQPKILTKEEFYNRRDVLQPLYPLTAGITNNMILKAVKQVLSQIDLTADYLPKQIRKKYNLITYNQSIREIHFPKDKEHMSEARKRIVFDEFFLLTVALNKLKKSKGKEESKYIIKNTIECDELIQGLPYDLTSAQKRVWQEIKNDLSGGVTMNRLIQGDVGSGKTIIAALALLLAAKNGFQGSFMVPTEVLAKQHYESLQELYAPYGIRVSLLVGSMTAREKRDVYHMIKSHETDVIVGTHALIQEKVEYDNLALVITDEQHRFGVKQREALSNKGIQPHVLVMSATPIPRTLAIILYGDLDISVIDELPANRLSIKNCVVNSGYRPVAYRFIEKEILSGRQAYVICPMVEESEVIEAENVIEYTDKLKEALSDTIQVEYLHGKMKAREKNEIMERFKKNEIQILVSTTVIEVGVNVPNATVIMIENAERFGLAGLHQLRGRVGRGKYQSYCILVTGSESKEIRERLDILNKSNDGFFIASEDLRLRGPGDMFGVRQSGIIEFKIGDIYTDAAILKNANEAAKTISETEILNMCEKYPDIGEKIMNYSGSTLL
mgnify:CR=1 FL=1